MPGKRTAKKSPVPEEETPGRKKIKGKKKSLGVFPPCSQGPALMERLFPPIHYICYICSLSPFCPTVCHPSHRTQPGLVLTLGQGDVGQLGLGEDVMERKKPALVPLPEMMVQVEAGGMHTVCLSQTGKVSAA